jgi:hypothetical protein
MKKWLVCFLAGWVSCFTGDLFCRDYIAAGIGFLILGCILSVAGGMIE